VRASHILTRADLNMVVMGEDSSGWASHVDPDVRAIDPAALAGTALDKALRGRNPRPFDPGPMTVVLEPDAVADLLEQVMMAGFGGQAYSEGVSFVNGRLGETIAHPMIHVWDDPLDPGMLALPFDAEGTPKNRLDLIEAGTARAIAHDRQTARRTCMPSTGHVSFGEEDDSPYPSRLRMAPGNRSMEALVREVSRGIYVTRFHYTNLADPHTASITGMTRDGTFLIENGEITRPLRNLRFTSSGLEALARVVALGRDTKLTMGYGGATRAPAALIEGFRFTGSTTF
jgi:predicted Zn-dependent protease